MSQGAERRMPKAVLLSPTLTASWPSQPVPGERIPYPSPDPAFLGNPSTTCSLNSHTLWWCTLLTETGSPRRFLPHFLMLIRAGSEMCGIGSLTAPLEPGFPLPCEGRCGWICLCETPIQSTPTGLTMSLVLGTPRYLLI